MLKYSSDKNSINYLLVGFLQPLQRKIEIQIEVGGIMESNLLRAFIFEAKQAIVLYMLDSLITVFSVRDFGKVSQISL